MAKPFHHLPGIQGQLQVGLLFIHIMVTLQPQPSENPTQQFQVDIEQDGGKR